MSMQCDVARPLIELYADGELELSRSLELERHLETCAGCTSALDEVRTLSHAVRQGGVYGPAPVNLKQRVMAAVRQEAGEIEPQPARPVKPARTSWWRPMAIAATAFVILAVFGWHWLPSVSTRSEPNTLLAQEVLDSHVRSLMADHLFDVPSTDQHTVKPWFDGKLDFAPPVVDLKEDGFDLAGGRLDYIDGRPVATLVYRRRKHIINVSMWPDTGVAPVSATMRHGYNLLHWKNGTLEYWAVSDLNASELREFVNELQAKTR